MKAVINRLLVVLFCLIPSLNLHGQTAMPEPNWDRSLAVRTIHKADAQATLKPLFQMARTGNNKELLTQSAPTSISPKSTRSLPGYWKLSHQAARTRDLDRITYLEGLSCGP